VQLLLEDPNHPRITETSTYVDVPIQAVSEAVAARLAKLNEPTPRERKFYRSTEWSAPSDLASLPPAEQFYVGTNEKSRLRIGKNGAQVHLDPLEVKFAAVYWDETLAADVSTAKESIVGTVLNYKGDLDVPNPLTLEFKILEDYDLRAKAVVADIRGGEEVQGKKSSEELYSPVECAVVDAAGNLVIRNEIDDLELYRRYAYVEEENQAAGGMPGGMMGGAAGSSGMMPGGPGGLSSGAAMSPDMMMGGAGGATKGRGSSPRGGNRNKR
jgi:hypothetical protein